MRIRKREAADSFELSLLTEAMIWLFRLHLMCEMGFSKLQAREHILNNWEFKRFLDMAEYADW